MREAKPVRHKQINSNYGKNGMNTEVVNQLKKSSLFRELSGAILIALSGTVRLHHLKTDDFLFRKGDIGNSLFIISKGRIKVVVEEDESGVELTLNELGPGDMVGEMALFGQAVRSAGAIALDDVDALELSNKDFLTLINEHPDVALSMIRDMSTRMRFNTTLLQKMTDWNNKITRGDFSFIEQKQSTSLLAGASDDERAEKFLSAFLDMARDVQKVKERRPHFTQLQEIEPDLRIFLPVELYSTIYVEGWEKQISDVNEERDAINREDGEKLQPVFNHLSALQKILSDYTSTLITEKRMGDEKLIKRNGALMFTDLAGFTKLMEENAKMGREGADKLLETLKKYFTDIIEIVSMSGGNLLEFTGDALLIWFPIPINRMDEEKNIEDIGKAVGKAVRSGLRMQRRMNEKYQRIETSSGNDVKLQMRIGIHAGDFYSADIGTPRRQEHVLLGRNVQDAKHTESNGSNGEVNLSFQAYQHVQDQFRFKEGKPGYMLVVDDLGDALGEYEIIAKPTTCRLASTISFNKKFEDEYVDDDERKKENILKGVKSRVDDLVKAIKPLASFIPVPVLNLLIESAADRKIQPDFATPTIMFVNFIGLPEMINEDRYDKNSIIDSYNEIFAKINAAVEKRGGVLKKVTYHLTGADIVIYFGVPTAHTDDPMRAASAALDIRDIIREVDPVTAPDVIARRKAKSKNAEQKPPARPKLITGEPAPISDTDNPVIYCKIGINIGRTFVAEIGAKHGRREFNVLGDTVNTTARLMSRADVNQILVSAAIKDNIAEKYDYEDKGQMELKGKKDPFMVYELTGQKAQSSQLTG